MCLFSLDCLKPTLSWCTVVSLFTLLFKTNILTGGSVRILLCLSSLHCLKPASSWSTAVSFFTLLFKTNILIGGSVRIAGYCKMTTTPGFRGDSEWAVVTAPFALALMKQL